MSLSTLAFIGGALLVLYLLPLILAVIALRSGAVPIPRFAEVDAAWLEPRWLEVARTTLDRLSALGFVHRTYLDGMAPRTAPTGVRCAAIMVNETTGDLVQVAVIERPDDAGVIELTCVTMLSFTLGPKRVCTSNGDMPGVFVYPKTFVGNALPMLHNVETLYRAHRALVARHTHNAKRGEIVARGNEVKYLTRQTADDMGYQVRRGLLKATTDGGFERTLRGTIYSVWKLHPRFIGRHRLRMHEKGLRTLAELGITPDPEIERPQTFDLGKVTLSAEMEAFVASACAEYTAAVEQLQADWRLNQATHFDADMTAGIATFHLDDGRVVVGDFQIIGTWARQSSWEWAWNNPNVAAAVKPDGDRIREFGEKNGIEFLASGFVAAPSLEIAAYFAAIGGKIIGSSTLVPLPPDPHADVVALVALRNLRSAKPNAA